MYEPVFESLQKAVAGTLQAQQELFKQWTGIWPAVFPSPPCCEKAVHFQKKWAEFKNDLVKKQCELLETQFKAGLSSFEGVCQVTCLNLLPRKSIDGLCPID